MSIISTIGRRNLRTRALIGCIYGILVTGAVTMVYPFLLMIAGTTKSGVDQKEQSVVPAFLYDDLALYRKHIEGLFNESLSAMQTAYDLDTPSFESLTTPTELHPKLVQQWREFQQVHDAPLAYSLGYLSAEISRCSPLSLRKLKAALADEFGADIGQVNRELGTDFVSWNAVVFKPESYLSRREKPAATAAAETLRSFRQRQSRAMQYALSVDGFYKTWFLKTQYTRDIVAYNRSHGTNYSSYAQVHLPQRVPSSGTDQERRDWEQFVRSSLNLLWIRADHQATPFYQKFLEAKYSGIELLNKNYKADYTQFGDILLPTQPPQDGLVASDWESFLEGWIDPATSQLHQLPVQMISVESTDFKFCEFLIGRFGSVENINTQLDTGFTVAMDILPPQRESQYLDFLEQRGSLRWEFATRNFRAVVDYMLLHGRGITNTLVYCALAVACALIFNPLAAYAMSRFQLPGSYWILLFLLLTMAFPAMVTQIPTFLMLRNLGLLNSLWALILPGLANGFSIFLLKGFFDSLPRELYESAALDGAGEWTVFWQLTMRLSTPVLAVTALAAFSAAYTNFLFAMLICQREDKWTVMVWLYQLQQRSGPGMVYSALILAAIPVLLVFLFTQQVMMRGIVVPVEK